MTQGAVYGFDFTQIPTGLRYMPIDGSAAPWKLNRVSLSSGVPGGLESNGTLEPAVTLVGGFEDPDGSYWGRPVDAVPGPDGALYVSDDTAGAIYRLEPPA